MSNFKIKSEFFVDDDIDPNSYLWKFISIEKFLSLIVNEELHLTRLDNFDDKREATSFEYLATLIRQDELRQSSIYSKLAECHTIIYAGDKQNKLKESQLKIQKSNFANCWYLSEDASENVAMWNLYSGSNSVALRIKYQDFKSNLLNFGLQNEDGEFDKMLFSRVQYYNFSDKQSLNKILNHNSLFIKDKSFEYEREFRIIVEREYEDNPFKEIEKKEWIPIEFYEQLENNLNTTSIKLKLNNFKDYPFNIVFHPKCAKWIQQDIIKILTKFNVPFKTKNSIIQLR